MWVCKSGRMSLIKRERTFALDEATNEASLARVRITDYYEIYLHLAALLHQIIINQIKTKQNLV